MSDAVTQEVLGRLLGRVDDLTAQLLRLEADVQDIEAATSLGSAATAAPSDSTPSEQVYNSVEDWVHDYYLRTFVRPIGGEIRWCTEWQQHAEAVVRFEGMWRSWEALRLERDLGMSTWLVNHLDPNAPMLHGRTGPFAQCTPARHSTDSPLGDSPG
jgi:hypothetical protein